VWRLMRMMASWRDMWMLWDIGKGFLRWLWRGREDRVAAPPASHRLDETRIDPEMARQALYAQDAVVESPRTDATTAKPSHRTYQRFTERTPDRQ